MKRINYLKIIGLIFLLSAIVVKQITVEKLLNLPLHLETNCIGNIRFLERLLLTLGLFFLFFKKIPTPLRLTFTSTFITLLILEIVLRMHPLLLGDSFANKVLTKYQPFLTGIYQRDHDLKMNFMKPGFQVINYSGGRKWLHQTDNHGFRNPITRKKADILLLGDSFIYGHGVNHNQTVGYFLEQYTDYSVINMARQGDCVWQQAYLLNQYGLKFKPKYVLYFFFTNDILDLTTYLSKDEMKKFIDTPIEKITFPPKKNNKYNIASSNLFTEFLDNGFYITQASKFMLYNLKKKRERFRLALNQKKISKSPNPPLTNKTPASKPHAIPKSRGTSIEWQYTKKAILQMKHILDLNSAKLVIVPIPLSTQNFFDILIGLSHQNNIPFIDAREMENIDAYYLSKDGHFNEEGAKKIAKIISEWLLIQNL